MKEFIIFVCTDSTEIFLSKLRSSCSNYNLPSFSLTLTVRGVSNKHCLLTFFIFFVEGIQDPNTPINEWAIIGPPAKCHLNGISLVCR